MRFLDRTWVSWGPRHDLYLHEHSLDDNPLAFTKMAQFTKSLYNVTSKRGEEEKKGAVKPVSIRTLCFFGGGEVL